MRKGTVRPHNYMNNYYYVRWDKALRWGEKGEMGQGVIK